MSKPTTKKTPSPGKLSKGGKKSGIALTEKQLETVSGGLSRVTIKF